MDKYFPTSKERLHKGLMIVASGLEKNLKAMRKKGINVGQIVNGKSKNFNAFFKEIEPNGKHETLLDEYKGVYAFGSFKRNGEINIQYVGISRAIRRRFFTHTASQRHNYASWVYKMVKKDYAKRSINWRLKSEKEIKGKIKEKQESRNFRNLYFAFHPVPNDAFMYMAEVFCSSYFKSKWNDFSTH
jgi:hypothetical protein